MKKIVGFALDETKRGERLDIALLVLRIALGLFFINHGWGKWFSEIGIDGFANMLTMMNFPAPEIFAPLVFAAEFLGGIALILGVLVRFSAFWQLIILFEIVFKVKGGDFAKSELELLAAAGIVTLLLVGSGKYSLANYLTKFLNKNKEVAEATAADKK